MRNISHNFVFSHEICSQRWKAFIWRSALWNISNQMNGAFAGEATKTSKMCSSTVMSAGQWCAWLSKPGPGLRGHGVSPRLIPASPYHPSSRSCQSLLPLICLVRGGCWMREGGCVDGDRECNKVIHQSSSKLLWSQWTHHKVLWWNNGFPDSLICACWLIA